MKIKVKTSWDYPGYYFNKIKLNEKSGGKSILENGDVIKYKSVPYNDSVYDMGHTYEFVAYKLIATINYCNTNIEVDLTQLPIKEIIEDKPNI